MDTLKRDPGGYRIEPAEELGIGSRELPSRTILRYWWQRPPLSQKHQAKIRRAQSWHVESGVQILAPLPALLVDATNTCKHLPSAGPLLSTYTHNSLSTALESGGCDCNPDRKPPEPEPLTKGPPLNKPWYTVTESRDRGSEYWAQAPSLLLISCMT